MNAQHVTKKFYLPRTVLILGIVSLLMSISSVTTMILSPVFITEVLGATKAAAGIIEGIVEFSSSFIKIFSGKISDYLHKRKFLIVIGYTVSTLTRPLFALAKDVNWIVSARILDRLSNGMRDTPRDALVADAAPEGKKGACFGFQTTMSKLGSFLGAALVIIYLIFEGVENFQASDFRTIFWFSLIPCTIAVSLLVFGIKEKNPTKTIKQNHTHKLFSLSEFALLSKQFWLLIVIIFIFNIGRFGEGLLVLRSNEVFNHDPYLSTLWGIDHTSIGFRIALIALVMISMNLIYTLTAYPMGKYSDKINRKYILMLGAVVLVATDYALGSATTAFQMLFAVVLWGLQMGITQGAFAALIVDKSPKNLHGTAFGIFHLFSGLSALVGNAMGGYVWNKFNAQTMYTIGSVLVIIAFVLMMFIKKGKK